VDGPDDEAAAPEPLAKPDELLALHDVTAELFATLRRWFAVPDVVGLDLSEVDAAVRDMADPVMIAALAMRKLQALRLLSTPGVVTTTDVVVTIVQDLDRALVQAPAMRLRLLAAATDWDAALAALEPEAPAVHGEGAGEAAMVPRRGDDEDPEVTRFRARHLQLHDAVRAVITASDGQIRELS
jgi:hypothetical protein